MLLVNVVVLEVCKKEIKPFPEDIIKDFLDALGQLRKGINLSMPLSRPMPSIASNTHELRLKDRSGVYRFFYVIVKKDAIYVVHAFHKKTQKTPQKNIDLAKKRIRRLK